jgi:pimeloyl-ACP methyl ester carboxylesterase
MTPDSRFVDVNGVRIHYLTWRGDDTSRGPIVLCHATGFLARLWEPIATRLAGAGFEVIAADARGHGDSDKPDPTLDNYHWRHVADDLRGFMDALGLRGVPVVGHSMGGGCALFVAGNHPQYFSRLAVFEPIVMPGGFQPDEAQRDRMAAGARKRRTTFESVDEIISQYRQRDTFKTWRDDVLRLYAEQGTFIREDGRRELKCSGLVEGALFANSGSLDIWSVLPKIGVPVLVMRGETTSEGFMRLVAEGVVSQLPDAHLVVTPGAGHLAPMESPDVVAAQLLAFLATG